MAEMRAESVDTIITDPPYGLSDGKTKYIEEADGGSGFMGKGWDRGVPGVEFWEAALRVAKPGATLCAFGGPRTFHRLACAIEDAGWEIRDVVSWVFAQGFPKSLDISKALDKRAGAEREKVRSQFKGELMTALGVQRPWKDKAMATGYHEHAGPIPVTLEAQQWHGWGTALKPAWEPILVAMKPTVGAFADNALRHGVAGLWIDGARIAGGRSAGGSHSGAHGTRNTVGQFGHGRASIDRGLLQGRWPANFILSHHPDCNGTCVDGCPVKALDEQSGEREGGVRPAKRNVSHFGSGRGTDDGERIVFDSGGASRFFYCAKASPSERDAGLDGLETVDRPGELKMPADGALDGKPTAARRNDHPTVKPFGVLRWLCRLTKTPTGGNVFDPFMGSGSTGCAVMLEGRDFIGCDIDMHYLTIAGMRIEHWRKQAESK